MSKIARLPHRGVVRLTGPDRVAFLNGLVSNDVAKAIPGQAVWAALLTPQGRYLFDFFVFSDGDQLFLDVVQDCVTDLIQALRRFKLRAKVEIEDASLSFQTYAIWHAKPPSSPLTAADPRLADAGYRCLSVNELTSSASSQDYAAYRLVLGLPDSAPDLDPGKTLLLEAGFDELHGIDWQKGCYMGQELTARTKYRGLVKRRLLPVTLSQTGIPAGTPILANDQEVGTLRSSEGIRGLAMLQLSALAQPLFAANATLDVQIPDWINQPGITV